MEWIDFYNDCSEEYLIEERNRLFERIKSTEKTIMKKDLIERFKLVRDLIGKK